MYVMRVILNPKHESHVPPLEVENGAVIPCYETPAAGRRDTRRARSRWRLHIRGAAALQPRRRSRRSTIPRTSPTCAKPRPSCAGRGSSPRECWPTVFPYGPNPRAGGERSLRGQYCFDTYTPILGGTFAAALGGASAALHAAELIAAGTEKQVYVLTRPPGHHAERDRAGGYCYFNNVALAAERLARIGKVAVLDIDIHHGNGAQHIFYDRADVLTVSIHGDPAGLYPFFSGYAEETGTGPGLGCNLNLPLAPGAGQRNTGPRWRRLLEMIGKFKPAFLVVAFGTDAHEADPIGGCKLPTGYFREMGAATRELSVPTIISQEGGYNLDVVGPCTAGFLAGLSG